MLTDSSRYGWFFKYKLYHLPFWFVYHYLWWTVTIGSAWDAANNILYSAYSIKFGFYVVFQAIGVYFNLYYLIPKLLEKGYYIRYICALLVTIVVIAACIATGYPVSAALSIYTFQELYYVDPQNYTHFFQVNTLPSTAASMTLAMSVKLGKNWMQTRRREQELEKEKLETELKFLKSQFNPHFLFNTINSIFVLIHKNPLMASDSLAKFSELLRYQLYECNEPQIRLDQELSFLENFIELEKLRQDHVAITLTRNIDPHQSGNLGIAPFLLIPFVENAFKHVSQGKDHANWIRINIQLEKSQLRFEVTNSTSVNSQSSGEVVHYGGIGLKNVQRRLDLIYSGEHQLEIRKEDHQFHISLALNLEVQQLAERMVRQA